MTLKELQDRGFDESKENDGYIHVRCSQCAALVINGVACHETGCPNETHECEECGHQIPKWEILCEDCILMEEYEETHGEEVKE